MKKLLLILLCLPLLFTTCKKDGSTIEIEEESNVNNVWQLSMQSTSLSHGDQYTSGSWLDSSTGSIYTGRINYVSSGSIMVSNDTIFPGVSTSYSSRVWSINENQFIIDTYYDENGFAYNISEHNFTKNLDTLVVNFQSGDIKKFVIKKLTSDKFYITSIPDTKYSPVFNINGVYQDTILMHLTSDKYFFDIMP
jgi:hypothetical protein|tara:strand:- start:60 stop:641 length:582 start_codon:yes stop_codon:yes gene_type:complete